MTKINHEKLNRLKLAEKDEIVYIRTGSGKSILTPYDLKVVHRKLKSKAAKQAISNKLNIYKSNRKQKNKARIKKFRKRLANETKPKKEAKAVFNGVDLGGLINSLSPISGEISK